MQIPHDFITTKSCPKIDKSAFGSDGLDQRLKLFCARAT